MHWMLRSGADYAQLVRRQRREDAVRLMTHPGIGPITSLAFVLAIGPITRFRHSKKIASYLGLNPSEASSGGKRRLGAISKQGNTMVRWLLIETVHHAVRQDPALRQDYQRLKFRRGHAVAKVAIALGTLLPRAIAASEKRIMVGSK
jgi:transposase